MTSVEMDEMELDRYITGMLDTEHRNMKKNVSADKLNRKRKKAGDDDNDSQHRMVESDS